MHSEKQYNTKKGIYCLQSKQYLDQIIGVVLLLVSSPFFLIIAIFIKLSSPGPVIFTQLRLGKNRKPFRFYKFRTMYDDAEKKFPKLYEYKYSKKEIKTMQFKIKNDPRLTKFGKYLRKTSLDELPNLINVIKGEMTFIGPRPEIPEMLKYYSKYQILKFSVKPGITGYAQVNGRGLLTFQETISQDLQYIKDQNFLTDLKILAKTLIVVIKGLGAF